MTTTYELDGKSLSIDQLVNTARDPGASFTLASSSLKRVSVGRQLVLDALDSGEPVYGLTTGLGSRVGEKLDPKTLQTFSVSTLRGRAQSIGRPLTMEVVRAAMLIRLNTILSGASGASLPVVESLRSCLQSGLTPVIGSTGSVGVADLCWGATMGLALTGEGKMFERDQSLSPALEALRKNRVSPLVPGPKDGLVLASHSSFSAAMFGLNSRRARRLLDHMQLSCAMTMEAMRANLTPLLPIASKLHPQAGQAETAMQLTELLRNSVLLEEGNAERLQDPLSIRNAVHVHAAARAAIDVAEQGARIEINAVTDNPLVDIENNRILSCGSYHTAHLTVMCQAVSTSLVQMSAAQTARLTKLLSQRFSGLPQYLGGGSAASNGMAPLMKIAEALLAEIQQAATPVAHWPGMNADGVEDIQSHAPRALQGQRSLLAAAEQLCAIEFLMATRGILLRKPTRLSPAVQSAVDSVIGIAGDLNETGSWTDALNDIAETIGSKGFTAFTD